jgi:seryl-tRNA synthetase
MIDVKYVREEPDVLRESLKNRQNAAIDVDEMLAFDTKRREFIHETEQLRAEQNKKSQEFGKIKKEGGDPAALAAELSKLKTRINALGSQAEEADAALNEKMLAVPNLLHESVPIGSDEAANRVERVVGNPPTFDFEPHDHVDIGEKLGLFNFEAGVKLARARFNLSLGAGARLERALISFMLDIHTKEHGYTEVLPPFLVNSAAMRGTGQLPKFAEDSFRLEGDADLWLIPTAEVPLTNIHAGEILSEDKLPVYYVAYTPCFRSEAGSYGKDTRGMLRQHQFNKVEMVKLCKPETSFDELEKLTHNAEVVLQRLELPYRVVTLSSGDTGFSAAKTYDLEVWLPGQDTYREISSCSNCTDFQARRADIRFKRAGQKKTEHVHTLNGSGIAVGRTVIAILENYQQADGTVVVPTALRPYFGADQITGA